MPFSFRALRHRWGIAAPKLAVIPHVAWYWRALGIVAVLSLSLVLAMWMYDAGRRIAGFDATTSEGELWTLRNRVEALEDELKRLRASAASADSRIQIEKAAHAQLVKQLKAVEAENARLREEVSFFEGLAARGITDDKVAVSRFKVEQDAIPGEYRYRVLVTQGGPRDREFNGRLQFVVTMQLGGREVAVVIPEDKSEEAAYRLNFKRFFRAEGSFRVDPKATVRSVQVRVIESGATQPRVTQSYTLS